MSYFLHISGPYDDRTVEVTDEISIGRTDKAGIVIDDAGLSRLNTSFFVDEGSLYAADENSLNGTILNGEKLVGPPRALRSGDVLKIGSGTTVRVEIGSAPPQSKDAAAPRQASPPAQPAPDTPPPNAAPPSAAAARKGPPLVLIAAGVMTLMIFLFAGIAFVVFSNMEDNPGGRRSGLPPTTAAALIPVRVIDPLGGEDEDDLDDLIASWEVQEAEINASDVADISGISAESEDAELNVSSALLADRQRKALEDRPGEKGIRPAGLDVPKELFGDGVIKQKAKLREMNSSGYRQPMDFADLAEKRLSGELVEMPMATESFYLDVGGSAQDKPFSSFSFSGGSAEIQPGSPKYEILKRLADNFAGQKYDLNNSSDRKQIRMRLLRMFNQRAKPILKELAEAYFRRFGRPLRVTSLTRSMDYQILLNSNNPNSFKVRGEGALPPHTSGAAFDLARKHMPAEEQNFVMQTLAAMEREGKLDALIEYGVNACFHIFIYYDGAPPRM